MKKTLSDSAYQNNRKKSIDKILQGLNKPHHGDKSDYLSVWNTKTPNNDLDEDSKILNPDHLDPNEIQGFPQKEELHDAEFHKGESKDMDEDNKKDITKSHYL